MHAAPVRARPPSARMAHFRSGRRGSGRPPASYALDHVPLAPRGLQLTAQVLHRLSVVGYELFDALRDAVLDSGDLPGDLVHVCIGRAVALALAPQAGVLVTQLRDRAPDLAVEAKAPLRLRAGHLLAAVTAENQEAAHESPFAGEAARSPGAEVRFDSALRSAITALLNSRNRSGAISNTASCLPAAAHTTE